MRYGAAAIARGASVQNRRKCVLTGYGRKKVKDKFRCLRLCSRATALCEECAMCERSCGCSFRPTRAVGVQELMLVHSAGSTAKKWCGRWPRILRKLPSGACGGQFNGTLSTLGYEAQRVAGLHRRLRWTQASLAHRRRFGSAKCGSRMHILQNLPQRRLRWAVFHWAGS